jgi:hypothetical protein
LIIAGQNGHDWRSTIPLLRKALEEKGTATHSMNKIDFSRAGGESFTAGWKK